MRPPFDDADADIIFRSADRVDFRLYKVIISKSSAVFRNMLAIPDVNASTGEPQIVELTEDADTLENLLRLCYPVKRAVFSTVDEALPVFTAAKKYDIEVAVDTMWGLVHDLAAKESPSRAYAIACIHELPTLARRAARLLVKEADVMGLPLLPLELRSLTLQTLYAFARYRRQCLTAVKGVLEGNNDWLRAGDHPYKVLYTKILKKTAPNVEMSWIWYRCSSCALNPFVKIPMAHPFVFVTPSTLCPRLWWAHYEMMVEERLFSVGLDGCAATQKALLDQIICGAETCSTCAPHARTHLMVYAQALEQRIEKAIDEVHFELPFAVGPETDST
ncbi:uncharacterized protein TRAVEDRAFT_43523 [Trametes versicolor FP-101664 SS1]|uniref:uncharacterized protein n=1 Tax=Trametes versicolor (strain FP-101664) TaxID=717944 RepID=UPI00046225A8|nr:uncharacterized protein TRAVEDRAFT_43523 [Trametes versicolor FP-101664 SS1]EIW63218.1 hypothetical protein TRAVEDRAFT_43523 [Trametes versicolor FP-101664 SS1]